MSADHIRLVFPSALTRLPDASHVRPRLIGRVKFKGKTLEVFSSLIVKFLGLEDHYPNPELYKNEAMFSTPSKCRCGVVLVPDAAGTEAALSVHCDDQMTDVERNLFVNRVHWVTIRFTGVDREEEIRDGVWLVRLRRGSGTPGGIVLENPAAESATQANVRSMASQLRARGFSTVGDDPADAGLTMAETCQQPRSIEALTHGADERGPLR